MAWSGITPHMMGYCTPYDDYLVSIKCIPYSHRNIAESFNKLWRGQEEKKKEKEQYSVSIQGMKAHLLYMQCS